VSGECAATERAAVLPPAATTAPLPSVVRAKPGGRRAGAGRPRQHGREALRATLRSLTTDRIDGRTKLAVAVRAFKADIRRDLGGNLSRAEEAVLEICAQTWVQVSSLDNWLAQQPSLVLARKRTVLPVLLQRATLAESLAKNLERLGLKRKAQPVPDIRRRVGLDR
jgi:hypothetical protein